MPTAFLCCLGCRSGPLLSQVAPLHISTRSYMSAIQIFLIVITILIAVGLITCVLSHYKMGARSWSDQRKTHQPRTSHFYQPCPQQQNIYSLTPNTSSVMYSPATAQERQKHETGAQQDHLVRLYSVQTDLALNLPHSIALPDGEEGPHCNTKLLRLHDPDQHAEITRSFIRPPPNRTVPEGNSVLPFRSNSIGQKPVPSPTFADTTVFVARSNSMSSNSAQSSKLSFSREQSTPTSNLPLTNQIWLPSAAMNSPIPGASRDLNRTYSCSSVDSKYDDPPPPYSDVVNQWDVNTVNRQQNNGV